MAKSGKPKSSRAEEKESGAAPAAEDARPISPQAPDRTPDAELAQEGPAAPEGEDAPAQVQTAGAPEGDPAIDAFATIPAEDAPPAPPEPGADPLAAEAAAAASAPKPPAEGPGEAGRRDQDQISEPENEAETAPGTKAEAGMPEAEQPVDSGPVVARRGGGFLALLLGGVIAGLVGYGIAYWQAAQVPAVPDLTETVEAQAARLTDLERQVAALAEGPDLAPIEQALEAGLAETGSRTRALEERLEGLGEGVGESLDALGGSVSTLEAQLADLGAGLARIDARLIEVEKEPAEDGTLPDAAIAAYERQVQSLREEMAATRDEVAAARQETAAAADRAAARFEEAAAQLRQAQTERAQSETEASEALRRARARGALALIAGAVEAGTPFVGPLAELQQEGQVTLPVVLVQTSAEGVASIPVLQETYPDAARRALAAAREAGLAEEGGGVGGFLREQFQLRSTQPRAGADPDAILSRTEAALRAGRLRAALDELAALPEPARAAMADWIEAAETRLAARAAVEALSDTLTENRG